MRDASHYEAGPGLREAERAPLRWGLPAIQPLLRESLDKPTAGKKHAVHALVNEGRWVAQCLDCGSAQLASQEDPRFLCHECGNATLEGKWRPVVWPDDRGAIEDALGVRETRRQHWVPGESVTDLLHETAANTATIAGPRAKTWAGHTHTWPKRLPKTGDVECEECRLVLPAAMIRADRKENP